MGQGETGSCCRENEVEEEAEGGEEEEQGEGALGSWLSKGPSSKLFLPLKVPGRLRC